MPPQRSQEKSSKRKNSQRLEALRVPASAPLITADHVERAKPDPDVFLMAAQRLGVQLSDCIVVGDSVWDLLGARRAKALGVRLLCGGYGAAELEQAGAYRVYKDRRTCLHMSRRSVSAPNSR